MYGSGKASTEDKDVARVNFAVLCGGRVLRLGSYSPNIGKRSSMFDYLHQNVCDVGGGETATANSHPLETV
jgi:hypothetical protein